MRLASRSSCESNAYNLSLRWFVFVSLGNWKGVTYDVLFSAQANRQLTSRCDNFMCAFFWEGVDRET